MAAVVATTTILLLATVPLDILVIVARSITTNASSKIILASMAIVLADLTLSNASVILATAAFCATDPSTSVWPILVKIEEFVSTAPTDTNAAACQARGVKIASITIMTASTIPALMGNALTASTAIR